MSVSRPTAPAPAADHDVWPFHRPTRLIEDPLVQAGLFVVAVSALFLAFPAVDLWVSGLFFRPGADPRGFPAAGLEVLKTLREVGGRAVVVAVIVMAAVVAIKLLAPRRRALISPRHMLFAFSTLVVGPGILVNLIFKANWGRPRPVQIDAFGGESPFVGIWEITDHCASNCSFVSGEASSALWLITLAVVVPRRWRAAAVKAVLVLAVLLSLNRVAFGGHFASDILLSWGMTLMVIVTLHRWLYIRPPTALSEPSLDNALSQFGAALRRPFRRTG